ncbi:MAG: NAD(P)/FAD-dependent oxidoreductase [Clostridiales bacterium]|nr:NAD(P)/FAD-dependent oxidoreductase [Clostridiales bacterium]
MYDIIIIGAGPAGLSAGIYATTRNKNVLIIEKTAIGGMIKDVSEVTHFLSTLNHESGKDFALKLVDQAERYNLNVTYEDVEEVNLIGDVKTVKTKKNTYKSEKIILATGTRPRVIEVEGEKNVLENYFALNASKDGKNYKGKDVYVIGAGDGAVKEAIFLSNIASRVFIIHELSELNCICEFRDKLAATDNIEVIYNTRMTKLYGEEKIEAVELQNIKTGENIKFEAPGAGVFVYAGVVPNTEIYKQIDMMDGFIPTDESMETEIYNVFAAGDIRNKNVRQIGTAVSDGIIAGIAASK